MKRNILPLFALLIMVSLLGCVKPTQKEKRDFDSTRSFSHYYTSVRAAETPDTIYFLGDTNLYLKYVDKASGINGVFCGKPECRHQTKDCNAYLGLIVDALFVDSGRLYWISTEFDSRLKDFIYSMALDGTDRRQEAELPEDFIPSGTAAHRHYVLHDGWLYFGDVSEEIVDGEPILHNYVAAFPLDASQEPLVILREETPEGGYNNLSIQFYGGYLYILTNGRSALAGENESLYHCRLRRWETKTGELEMLYEDDKSELNWTSELWVTDDGVIFNRNPTYTQDVPLENRICGRRQLHHDRQRRRCACAGTGSARKHRTDH